MKEFNNVSDWIPTIPFVANYNVDSESFNNFQGKAMQELISDISWYVQRSIWLWVIPQDSIHLVAHNVWQEYLSYISDLKWKKLDKEQIIKITDIKSTCDKIISQINEEKYFNLNFISTGIAQDLMSNFLNSSEDFYLENLWFEDKIDKANSKVFLRENFSDYMVNWHILDTNKQDWIDDLYDYFDFYQKKWLNLIIRLDRSVSWLWYKKICTYKDIEELILLFNINKHTLTDKFLLEICFDSDSIISSPSCLAYINKNNDVDTFSCTNQLLNWATHEWNVVIKDDEYFENLQNLMKKLTNNIWSEINDKLWVISYYWIDFMLIDISYYENIYDIVWKNVEIVNVYGKDYALIVCEVNRRMTWAYSSAMINNLYFKDKDKRIANYNTFEYNINSNDNFEHIQNKIIMNLKKEWILFDPTKDSFMFGVYPFSIQKWKIQVVIISNNSEHENEIIKELESILYNLN